MILRIRPLISSTLGEDYTPLTDRCFQQHFFQFAIIMAAEMWFWKENDEHSLDGEKD